MRPPKAVADAAKKGLEYRERAGGKGGLTVEEAAKEGIGSGVQRAVNLKNRDSLSLETIKRMKAFFDRHKKNKAINPKYKDEPWKDRGYVAWLLWGGDPGYAWAKKVLEKKACVSDIIRNMSAAVKKNQMQEELFSFLQDNPNPKDSKVHAWAEDKGYSVDDVEQQIYQLATKYVQLFKSGGAKKKGITEKDVDPK